MVAWQVLLGPVTSWSVHGLGVVRAWSPPWPCLEGSDRNATPGGPFEGAIMPIFRTFASPRVRRPGARHRGRLAAGAVLSLLAVIGLTGVNGMNGPAGRPAAAAVDDTIQPWENLGGAPVTSMTVARNSNGRLEIFAVGSDHTVWHNVQAAANGPFSGWGS